MKKKQVDKKVFFVCLGVSIALGIGGFFCPPLGSIDGSVLTFVGILLGYATLAVAGQNLANGKDVIFHHGDTEITIGDDEEASNGRF